MQFSNESDILHPRIFINGMKVISILCMIILFSSCKKEKNTISNEFLIIDSVTINKTLVLSQGNIDNVDFENVEIRIKFKSAVDTGRFNKNKIFFTQGIDTAYNFRFGENQDVLLIRPDVKVKPLTLYRFLFDEGPNLGSFLQQGFSFNFITRIDTVPKFPLIGDDSLLTLVEKQTFRYFWDYAHPVSGLARERSGSGDIVTSGGSGFGVMAILTAIERGFVTRADGFDRLNKIVGFLNNCDRFHGAFPHWMNGSSGKVYPFSQKDNGGDLVETAFLMQGLITVREYFMDGSAQEKAMCDTITEIWKEVEWDWYRNNDQNKLFWHWSPDYSWEMNMPITGWNEALIVYVLAASSPTHSIPESVYNEGWARNGAYPMKNGKTFYNIQLPLGEDYGGPLFFAHYSFLGLDPRTLSDRYT